MTANPVPQHAITESSKSQPRPGRRRWAIAGLFGGYELVNYLDRINLSVAGPVLADNVGIDPAALGVAFSAFLWTYALAQIPAGLLIDRIGVKWLCRVAIPLWASACFLTAIANGLGLVILSRLILGVSEAPAFPAGMKATGNWFPRAERGLATAMFSSSGRLSNVIGAPIMGLAVGAWGWRGAFVSTGLLSVAFAIAFWIRYRDPSEAHRDGWLATEEFDRIRAGARTTTLR